MRATEPQLTGSVYYSARSAILDGGGGLSPAAWSWLDRSDRETAGGAAVDSRKWSAASLRAVVDRRTGEAVQPRGRSTPSERSEAIS